MEPTSLLVSTSLFECQVCFEVVENAVHCLQCKHFLCERHANELHDCPFCRATPFRVEIDHSIRRVVDQLPVDCQFCRQRIRKGDLSVHVNNCLQRPRSCGVTGCVFQSGDKDEALRHVCEAHGETFWENYNRLTAAVGNGIDTLCTTCSGLREQNSAFKKELDTLQRHKNQLDVEIANNRQQFEADIRGIRQQLAEENKQLREQFERENAQLHQKIFLLECIFTNLI